MEHTASGHKSFEPTDRMRTSHALLRAARVDLKNDALDERHVRIDRADVPEAPGDPTKRGRLVAFRRVEGDASTIYVDLEVEETPPPSDLLIIEQRVDIVDDDGGHDYRETWMFLRAP